MDFPIAAPITKALLDAIEKGDLGYPHSFTDSGSTKTAISHWATRYLGWKVPSSDVLLFADVMRVVETAVERFTQPGDGIVFDTPAYPPFFQALSNMGRTPVANPMIYRDGTWQIDLAGLEWALGDGARAYLLCNPHNPTGRVFSMEELRSISRLAAKHDTLIVADEVHSPVVYSGRRHIPMATVPESAAVRLVTAVSASKGWNIAGLKCAICLPGSREVLEGLMSVPARSRDGLSILGLYATAAALSEGEPWLRGVLHYLEANRKMLAAAVSQRLPEVGYTMPEGTYLAWLDCRRLSDRLGTDNVRDYILERGHVALENGSDFGCDGFVRVNFATSRPILAEIINRIVGAVSPRLDGWWGEAAPPAALASLGTGAI